MQKTMRSLRPVFIFILAAFLIVAAGYPQDPGISIDPKPDPDPNPNPVLPLVSEVLEGDHILQIANAQVNEHLLMTYAPNGTGNIPVIGYGGTIMAGILRLQHSVAMLAASGPYIFYGDSGAVYVSKREAGGDYALIFGLTAPVIGERFSHVAIDGKLIAVVSKTGPKNYFVRTFEVDFNGSFVAGGARHLNNIAVLKTLGHDGRIYYGLEYGGKYAIESNELKVLGDRQEHRIYEAPLIDFGLDKLGQIFVCSKSTAAIYDAFGNRTKLTDNGRDFRRLSVSPNGVLHIQDGGFDIRVFIAGASERKKIHLVDPVPVIGFDAFKGIGNVTVTTAGVWNLWAWDTGLAKTIGADSSGAQPPIQNWGEMLLQIPTGFQPVNLEDVQFTLAK